MTLTDILLLTDATSQAADHYALSLAERTGAHLTAAAISIDPTAMLATTDASLGLAADAIEDARQAADQLLAAFRETAARLGVQAETTSLAISPGDLSMDAAAFLHAVDLVVIGQPDPSTPSLRGSLIDAALFASGRPLLVIPYIQKSLKAETILVAWSDTPHAARALADATPWLKEAQTVEIVSVTDDPDEFSSATRLVSHLGRKGIQATARRLAGAKDVPNAILSHAFDVGADMLVLGAYGHSRFREMVLGGTTREILKSTPIPALMSH